MGTFTENPCAGRILGLTLLPEIHAAYDEKIYETLAEKGYATYDFFLPGLVIDAIENRRGTHLAAWAKEIVKKKISTVNMLGCHDGISLLDLKGLLPKEEIQSLIDRIVSRGGMVKNLHGQKNLYYQVNATYYSAFATLHIYESIYCHAGGREHEAILSVEDWKTA